MQEILLVFILIYITTWRNNTSSHCLATVSAKTLIKAFNNKLYICIKFKVLQTTVDSPPSMLTPMFCFLPCLRFLLLEQGSPAKTPSDCVLSHGKGIGKDWGHG